MSTLKAALEYTARGWFVFPAPPGTKKSHKKGALNGGARWGMTKDPAVVQRDWSKWPEANIGLPTGYKFDVVEVDTKTGHGVDGLKELRALEKRYGTLPNTLQAESPSGSIHYYFQRIAGAKNSAGVIAPGIDVRAEGGMVIAPPSVKPGSGVYRWRNNHPILPAPEWLVQLILGQKARNPFLDYGAPMSIEAKLDNLKPGSINDAQFSLCASFITRGMSVEQVVEKLLLETRTRLGSQAKGWNWEKEEQQIRDMCTRIMRSREENEKVDKKQRHIALGAHIMQNERFVFTPEGKHYYKNGLWTLTDDSTWREWINYRIEAACLQFKIVSTNSLINETRAWLERQSSLYDDTIVWDSHGMVPTRNGLVDIKTGKLTQATAEHYCTYRLDIKYDARAKCPLWEQLLNDMFEDKGTIKVIQEHLGVGLIEVKSKNLHRALVLIGAPNTGKTELLSVMSGLFGEKAINATFDSLEESHGTMPFMRRAPWVLQEAFDSGKWHITSTVKQLISGEGVNVNIKNGKILHHVYRSPIFWGTNTPPQFKEAGNAMVERLTLINTYRVFNEVKGVAKIAEAKGYGRPYALILAEEKTGLLNWALEGAVRALKQKCFTKTNATQAASAAFYRASNIVLGFIEDCVIYDSRNSVASYDFKAAYDIWWQENQGDNRVPSARTIGMHINALADRRMQVRRSNSVTFYDGLKLNAAGLEFWQTAFNNAAQRGSSMRFSSDPAHVNRAILPTKK